MNRKIKKRKERRFNVYNPSNNNNTSRRKRRRKKNSNSDDDENGRCNQSSLQPSSLMSADAAAAAAAGAAIAVSFLTNILDPFIKQSTFHRLSTAAAAYHLSDSIGEISSISLIWHILYSSRTLSASKRMPLGNYPIYFILHYRSQVIWNGMLRSRIGRERLEATMREMETEEISIGLREKKRWTIAKKKNVIRWQ